MRRILCAATCTAALAVAIADAAALRTSSDNSASGSTVNTTASTAACRDASVCLVQYRTTATCAANATVTCGACLPGYIEPESPALRCTEDADLASLKDKHDGDHDHDDEDHGDKHGMPMQEMLGAALGTVLVIVMCLVTWSGWVACCNESRTHGGHRAFIKSTTTEWQCSVCLHDNSALRRYCVMCQAEVTERVLIDTNEPARKENGDYSLIETPRAGAAQLHRIATFELATLTPEQRVIEERLEWKRCMDKCGIRWMRFKASDVRRHKCLHGTIVSSDDLVITGDKNERRRKLCPRRLANRPTVSCAPSDGFFARLDSQSVVEWIPADQLTLPARHYKYWRRLPLVVALPFHDRLQWLYQEMLKLRDPLSKATYTVHVHRESVTRDSVTIFDALSSSTLRRQFRVDLIDEPGVDGGGIFREWLHLVCAELFGEATGVFKRTQSSIDGSGYWINYEQRKARKGDVHMYVFFGKLLGKAVLEGLVLNVRLSTPLLKHILGYPMSLQDIRFLDEQIYNSLVYILSHPNADQLDLTFRIGDQDLIPSGSEVPVTDANKQLYVDLAVRYYLFDSVEHELGAIMEGFRLVMPDKLLHIFDYKELDLIVSGLQEIDVLDWQAHTIVNLVGHRPEKERQVVDWFWEIVASLNHHQRCNLLQYVTGSRGVPVEGFSMLTSLDGRLQPFTLQLVDSISKTVVAMPYASTCFNRFDLPIYDTKEDLHEMILMLVEIDVTGFNRR